MKKGMKGLGKGLGALLPEDVLTVEECVSALSLLL